MPPLVNDTKINGRVSAWECVGCGRIEAPQTCIGACRDRKLELVDAAEHERVLSELKLASEQLSHLVSLARRMARAQPREGQWERSYRLLQEEAARTLADLEGPPRKAG